MNDTMNKGVYDDIEEMIKKKAQTAPPLSDEELREAVVNMSLLKEDEKANDPWLKRYHTLQSYKLDVVRDGSDEYFKTLTKAIVAITSGNYGSINYRGYKIYYTDSPHISSISMKDGNKEYGYEISFRSDGLNVFYSEEYNSEGERKAFLNPENELFKKTLALLDKEIEELDKGAWIKKKKTLRIKDFKDYTDEKLRFNRIEWEDRDRDAADTLSFLIDDAYKRTRGLTYTEDDFDVFADVIRRMVFFADYGKSHYLFGLQGFIRYQWKPKTKRNRYIWHCMHEFGQGDLPDILIDNCTIYYFLDDPQGWEAMAYLFPIVALGEMCREYEPDSVKDNMLRLFDMIPDGGYRERIERFIEEDRRKAEKGEGGYDQEDI